MPFGNRKAVDIWSTRMNMINKQITRGAPSYSESSLINFLVSGPGSPFTNRQKGLVLFEEPALICDLEFEVLHTPKKIPAPPISTLQLYIPYTRVLANPKECEVKVDVVVAGGNHYLPFIKITPTDLNTRNSTIGPCFRLYYCPSILYFESEALSTQYVFANWTVAVGSKTSVVPQLNMTLSLTDDTLVTAYYEPRPLIAP